MPEGDQDDPGMTRESGRLLRGTTDTPQHLNSDRPGAQVSFAARQIYQGYRPMRRGKL